LRSFGMEGLKTLEGQIPSPINPPSGCTFHTRCSHACEACSQKCPTPVYVNDHHYVSCLLFEQDGEK